MSCATRRAAITALAGFALLAGASPASGQEPAWRLEQPPPPPGAPFKVPLGAPGDLKFWAPNRGLLAVEGNALVPRGLFLWNGESWRQISTVCGGPADTMRIAWAGPTEWWTVSEPSRPRLGSGITLCRFKDGEVIASYGTAPQSPDPYRPMNAATCNGPDDCWFGGADGEDPTGARTGAFRLHWNGVDVTTSYGPQGRGITDLQAFGGTIFESVLVGRQAGDRRAAELLIPEPDGPRLIHRLGAGGFVNDPFAPQPLDDVPEDGTELLALDGADALWTVGGGAGSGPNAPLDGTVARPPIAATFRDGAFTEVQQTLPSGIGALDRYTDVAAIPGTSRAWVTVQSLSEGRSTNARARVALIDADTGEVVLQRLPAAGGGRGAAARIACPAPTECWLATQGGWLFRWTDGTPLPRDDEPAFRELITFRPNEAAAQFIPDAQPVDDSLLLAPPPVVEELPPEPVAATVRRLKPLLAKVRSRLRGRTLRISFQVRRTARVGLEARRGNRVVARARLRTLKPGRRALTVRLDPKRWPTRLRFVIREGAATAEPDLDSVTTGPATGDTATGDTATTRVVVRAPRAPARRAGTP